MRSVTVVGASLAGLATARALRRAGYDDQITVVGDEAHRPYDRPPLSKGFLTGSVTESDLALEAEGEDLGADWLLGTRAVALDPATGTVSLADGQSVSADAVVVATGSRARALPGAVPPGVHTLRCLDDARALKADLVPGARLVVVGAGFIGAEVASTALHLGLEVTVVEAADVPLSGPLGTVTAAAVVALHERRGVSLLTGRGVARFLGGARVTGVELTDGTVLGADVVVVGIGSLPNVEWLADSGLDTSSGLVCDSRGRTSAPNLFGVGDCSAWFDPARGAPFRVEHWTDSHNRATLAVAAMLGQESPAALPAPYFWSEQYDVRIQYAGRRTGEETVTIESGSAESEDLLAVYWRGEHAVAVLGMNQTREFGRWRRRLSFPPPSAHPSREADRA